MTTSHIHTETQSTRGRHRTAVRLTGLCAVVVPFVGSMLWTLAAPAGGDQGCPPPSAEYLVVEQVGRGADGCITYNSRPIDASVPPPAHHDLGVVQTSTGTTTASGS